ncbi:MAG: cytochrome c [Marinilabiliales bacterium]|nr:cytochrome c [Marinilabiliales bacterium]
MKQEATHDQIMMSHDYDGIKELSNPAPYWIMLLFLGTIGFSLFYFVHYFGYPNNGRDQVSEYNQQMAQFEKERQSQNNDASGLAMIDTKEAKEAGAKLFTEKGCIACHGMKGEGNAIGPNLTDHFWINGCKPENIIKMINEGKPEKGMTPFKGILTDAQIKSLTAYILGTLVGSNPPNAKAPQGVECK